MFTKKLILVRSKIRINTKYELRVKSGKHESKRVRTCENESDKNF